MDKEAIKRYILDFQDRKLPQIRKRELKLEDSSKIQVIIGARRVGKTYLLFNKMKELLDRGIKKEQFLYLNFENPTLYDTSFKEFKDILDTYFSLFPEVSKQRVYLFIDEPQIMKQWEVAIRSVYDDYGYPIFITGSSSKLLSKEIATSLRGRSLAYVLFPLSFREFLSFKEISFDIARLSTASKAQITHALEEYLKFGGYPEVVGYKDETKKLQILKEYLDLTIYRDIIERYGIKNNRLVQWLINYMMSSNTKEASINKIYFTIKSQNLKVAKDTLYEYVSLLEDAFFLSLLRKFDYSIKNEGLSIPKVYLNDVGFLNLISLNDDGKRIENTVFLELLRKKNNSPLMKVNYWKAVDGKKEVDFIISKGKKVVSAIQTALTLSDPITKEREVNSLVACLDYFGLKEGIIITKNEEGKEKVKDRIITIVPLWKWLLQEN